MSSQQVQLQLPVASSSSSSTSTRLSVPSHRCHLHGINSSLIFNNYNVNRSTATLSLTLSLNNRHGRPRRLVGVAGGGEVGKSLIALDFEKEEDEEEEEEEEVEPTADDLENIGQIKRVLELLKKNRDMLYGEVKLTIAIEDPRDIERKRLLGIDVSDGPTRDDLVDALDAVNEGKIPKNRLALQMLAEEMTNWPNLEVEPPKKSKGKSLYAKATDTGVDPKVAAKRLNVDWDTAAEIEEEEASDDADVPPAVGYGALYLVTAFPVIIGISVVLILFYNSLQ